MRLVAMDSGSVYVIDDKRKALIYSQLIEGQLTINMPETCDECKSNNFYLWGTNINKKLEINVRCIKCGKSAIKMDNKT